MPFSTPTQTAKPVTSASNPGSVSSAINAAKQALSQGNMQQALGLCQALIDKKRASQKLSQSESIEVHYIQAVSYRYLKQYKDAQLTLQQLLEIAPDYARGVQEQGHLYLAQQQDAKAAQAFYQATLLNPALVGSWRALLNLYQQQSSAAALAHAKENLNYWSSLPKPLLGAADALFSHNRELADRLCRQFLQQHKHHIDGLYLLALVDIHNKAYDEAEFLLESCYELAPKHTRASAEYAALLNRIGKYQQALELSEVLLAPAPDDLNYLVLKAVAIVGLGQVKAGIQLFKQILEQEPQRASLWLQLGHAQKSLGELAQAESSYKQALNYRTDYGDAYWSLANTKAYRFSENEIKQMQSLLDKPTTHADDRIHIHFALGKGQDDVGNSQAAFAHYAKGNAEKYASSDYTPALFSEQVDKQIAFFNQDFFQRLAKSEQAMGHNDSAPIFILGLPRAGSTLLEQILSSHSQVDATQELHNILGLAKRLRKGGDYPQMLDTLAPEYFRRFGEQFIQQTQAYRQQAPFFIDKMPNNFLHIGLIKLILPNAKVIDARRDPMDCTYSCYRQLFAEGQDFSYDLAALGQYYRDYERLMAHWQQVLPGFVHKVQHEDLFEDFEGQVRQLLDFCQLPFEQACLTYYQTERAVQTPSAAQVRKPINQDGVGRWKDLQEQLAPLRAALALEH